MNTMSDSWGLAWQLILHADAELLRIASLSLQVSASACVVGALLGLLLGAWLAVAEFPGHSIAVWLVNTLLALPAVVVGLLVYLLLSRSGPLGELGILFTPSAMVVAQSVLVTPLIAALSRRLVLAALAEGGDQFRSLGARPLTVALLMLVHERMGVATVLLTAFARAIAEVGAVMIVGGNIAGVTRVMTTTIALETSKGDLALALALGFVLLAVVGVVNGAMGVLHRLGSRVQHPVQPVSAAVPTPATTPPAAVTVDTGPLAILDKATVRLGAVTALRDVSLTLRRGDRLVLVGANGSGKTTLLKLLHGLVPHTGRCDFLPLQPEGRPPRLAMVFQQTFLLNLSVGRNLRIGLWLAGVPAAQRAERCRQALARVGLLGHIARPARTLSGGQQQRLGIARAWSQQPDLLLLDEPTASLDPSAKHEVENLIEEIGASGITIVASTHNLGQAKRLATRVAYLQSGELIAVRPVEQFFQGEPLPEKAEQFLKGELGWR
ncbi:ABC transporter permease [Variovorax dokdonensis]|uniref:ABC transporter permease n=1 Tax=Variovorax dokdonensis TaxID=344883 RepID=A0ABT7NA57_9BURK|nr:ABC transporter permease [Variovorax dokdonensis]MDM0044827.1 ABC transporter permease [Variovorax dokdonensis]